jgi:hypothetical protein
MRMRKDVAPAGNAPPTTNATGKPANAHAAGNLASVEATGDEVIVDAPSQQMYASAARIAYDFEHERLSVTPGPRTPRVTLRHQRQQLVARQLEYEPAPQGGLGKAWAEGPGTATLEQMVGMGVQQFQVDWAKDLRLLPQDGMHVLTIREQARVSSPSWGTFTAGELFVWLKENAAPVVRQPSAAGGLNVGNLEPDRLLASGRVTVDTPQMTGETERFEAWFRQATPPVTNLPAAVPDRTVPIVPQPGPPTTAPSTTPLSPPADAGPDLIPARPASLGAFARPSPSVSTPVSSPSQPIRAPDVAPLPAFPNQATAEALAPTAPLQRFHVTGKLVRARLVRHPAETTMEDLAVEGNVRIVETQTAEPNAIPAEIAGDIVQLQNGYSNEALLQVVGQPAVVNARGMRLAGASIKLHRGENRAWIDGPGEAEALVSRALFAPPGAPQVARPSDAANGKDEKPQVARLSWQGGAKFDGQTLIVSKQVLARTEKDLQILTADSLTVTLDHFVDFQRSNLERTPQVATLRVDGGVKLQNRSLDEAGQLLSAEQFEIRNFSIDQRTGRLEGEGPGYLSSKRTGGVALAGAGFPAPAAAATGNAKLMSVLITFQGNLVGNISQREIQFQRQVRTALGPIAQWDDKFDPRSAEELGEQGVVLTSDKLTAAEMRLPALGQSWMELEASGNALVEGKLFTASAQRLAYSTGKEMLVVEGDGRTDAELWYRPGPGQPRAYQAARKIMYWRKTNAIEVSDAKAIDLDQLTIPSLPGISGLRRP